MKTYKSNFPQIVLKLKKGEEFNCQIKSSSDAAEMFKKIWDSDSLEIYESMICIFLNRANNTIGWLKVSQGGLSGTVCDIKLIFATALNCLASSIILAHNHPSGNLNPSENDKAIFLRLRDGGKLIDVILLDHLVLTADSYYSFADNGII